MNREQFLRGLDKLLKQLPRAERDDILQDFDEHFAFGMAEGKTEEEIATTLGSPHKIAKELLAAYHVKSARETASANNILRAVWAVIGLGFFNLVIVFVPFITIAALIVSGWVFGIGLVVSPLLFLVNLILFLEAFSLFELFFSMVLSGIGLFIAIGMYFVTRVLMIGLIRYLQFNIRFVKGGLENG